MGLFDYVRSSYDLGEDFTNVELQCGNLLWHKKADGHFELIREQEHFIDKASQEKLTPSEITQLKVQFGCKQP